MHDYDYVTFFYKSIIYSRLLLDWFIDTQIRLYLFIDSIVMTILLSCMTRVRKSGDMTLGMTLPCQTNTLPRLVVQGRGFEGS